MTKREDFFQQKGTLGGKPCNILLVTVTEIESQAVIEVFGDATKEDPQPQNIGDRLYHNLGIIKGAHIFMALSEKGTSGLGASLQAVEKGIDAVSPIAVIMVGIAFGINEQKQAIGDILVSEQLYLYDLQHIGADRITPRGDKPHASSRLLNYFRGAKLYWDAAIEVRFGLILSGDKLVDNVDYRDQLKQFEPEAIGGEMEGGGLYVAAEDRKVDWILVKAICDWADGNKAQDKEQRQQLAASNAARFVLHALQICSWQDTQEITYGETPTSSEVPFRDKLMPIVEYQRNHGGQVRFEFSINLDGDYEWTLVYPVIGDSPDTKAGILLRHTNAEPLRLWKDKYITVADNGYLEGVGHFYLTAAAMQFK